MERRKREEKYEEEEVVEEIATRKKERGRKENDRTASHTRTKARWIKGDESRASRARVGPKRKERGSRRGGEDRAKQKHS